MRMRFAVFCMAVIAVGCPPESSDHPWAEGRIEGSTVVAGGRIILMSPDIGRLMANDKDGTSIGDLMTADMGALKDERPNKKELYFPTDPNGHYSIELGSTTSGTLVACVEGGAYFDVATSMPVDLGPNRMCGVAQFTYDKQTVINISPVSHWAYSKALYLVEREHVPLAKAYEVASADINNWVGCADSKADLVAAAPAAPPKSEESPSALLINSNVRLSVLQGALSYQAKLISDELNLLPGSRINALTIIEAFADDLRADGLLDGRGTKGPIEILGHRMTSKSGRGEPAGLAHGLSTFLHSPHKPNYLGSNSFAADITCLSTGGGSLFHGYEASVNAFDKGPEIELDRYDPGNHKLDEHQILHEVVYFQLKATHDFGIDAIDVWVDEQPQTNVWETATPARYAVDTRRLEDGPHTLRAHARNSVAKTGERSWTFHVDNTGPVITVTESSTWISGGSLARIEGNISKPTDSLTVTGEGIEKALHTVEDQNFTLDVEVPCNAKTTLFLSTKDAAGNESQHKVVVICDSQKPIVTLTKASYRPENEMVATYDDAGRYFKLDEYVPTKDLKEELAGANPSSFEIFKYMHRLDYLPSQGLTAAAQNLPLLSFDVFDPGTKESRADKSSLVVEYRYLLDEEMRRDWTALENDGKDIFLPLSFQTLHPDLWRKGRHQIEVRATDLAGNVSESIIFSFDMKLLLPPLAMSECRIDRLLGQRNYEGGLSLYRQPRSTDAHSAVLRWNVPLPTNSLAPQESLAVVVSGGRARMSISRFEGRVVPADHSQRTLNFDNACFPATFHNIYGVHRDSVDNEIDSQGNTNCVDHVLKNSRALCILGERTEESRSFGPTKVGCSLRDITTVPQAYRVQSELSAVASSAGPQFTMSPGDQRTLITTLEGPQWGYIDLAKSADKNLSVKRYPFIRFTRRPPGYFPPFVREDFDYALYAKGMQFDFSPLDVRAKHSSGALVNVQRRGTCNTPLTVEFK